MEEILLKHKRVSAISEESAVTPRNILQIMSARADVERADVERADVERADAERVDSAVTTYNTIANTDTIDHTVTAANTANNTARVHTDTLVFEGGGVLGSAYIGALEVLHNSGILSEFKNFGGTSAGAIFAGLLAIGADLPYIKSQWKGVDFRRFIDYGSLIGATYRLFRYYGAASGDYFVQWYGDLVEELTGLRDITLEEVNAQYGGRLVITTVNMTERKLRYLDYISDPKLPLVLAVRMSVSISFMLVPVLYEDCIYVDGGLLDNFPVRAFPDNDILGLMLVTDAEYNGQNKPITGLASFTMAHLEILLNNPQKIHVSNDIWDRVIKINVGHHKSTDFNISESDKERLVERGRKFVEEYIAQHIFEG
jgi:predicted acylesterase/phospholipase RssA